MKALITHASKDRARIHLNSVCFDGPNGVVVATDGHRLLARFSEPFSESVTMLSVDSLKLAVKSMNLKSICHIYDGDAIRVRTGEGEPEIGFQPCRVNAQFPPYEQVMSLPSGKDQMCGFDAKLLASTLGVLGEFFGKGQTAGMAMEFCGELEPCRISFIDDSTKATWVAVVMPCRHGLEESPAKSPVERLIKSKAPKPTKKKRVTKKTTGRKK